MDLETSTHRLATGLTRVAVAVQAAESPTQLERTIAQQQVLLLLSRRSEVYPLSELSADLNMTSHATMSAIATLAREGLVSVDPSPSYAPHAVRIALTELGRAQSPELLNWAADLLAELHQLDREGQHQLLAVVAGQIRRMQREGQIPVTKMCVTCRYFDGYAHPGTEEPHHCWLIDKPFGHQYLRLRCPEGQPGEGPVRPDEAA
ncbi:MarR family winged helix-turn-helix transcriptional regulator [Phytohabitans suffuscus]|uniref:Transcriptional regulator n=1 Tax=Phytohabitans suffuscus TaxID=624315 RepID=A0A6F8YSC2_9ACTN|nr:MarR family winged helix-turn-helix transcriptional regulator [Phytohabitans suffuscus]BCB88959.1 transcriptional regulator [Phytohabitans suffuscus]